MRPQLAGYRILVHIALALSVACGSESSVAPVPAPRGSVTITIDSASVYVGDAVPLHAVVRDAEGRTIPEPSLSWSVADTTIAVVSTGGVVTAIRPGATRVLARAGELSATLDLTIRALSVRSVEILGLPDSLGHGDVIPFEVRVRGEGGRLVTGRGAAVTSAEEGIALVDPSGRLRAVAPGRTDLTATVDGVVGRHPVVVSTAPALHALQDIDGARLPLLIAADTVEWNGVRELAEVYAESGALRLTGGATPRYAMAIRYAQYAVTTLADGSRRLELRARFTESDYGVVSYDARGELVMTSEYTAPLSHTASASAAGIAMRYRIPGDDTVLSLFFRRD